MKSITWGFGIVVPAILLLLGLYSIVFGDSIVPMSSGSGRFSVGTSPTSGLNAQVMGVAFIAFACMLVGTCFDPLRKRYEKAALSLQIGGLLVGFFLLAFVLLLSR